MKTRILAVVALSLAAAFALGGCSTQARAERKGKEAGDQICKAKNADNANEAERHLRKADDKLDDLKTQIFRELLTYMLQDPATIEAALDLILISRHLERIGDHATNIAEDVIFMVSARDVRHHATDSGAV